MPAFSFHIEEDGSSRQKGFRNSPSRISTALSKTIIEVMQISLCSCIVIPYHKKITQMEKQTILESKQPHRMNVDLNVQLLFAK